MSESGHSQPGMYGQGRRRRRRRERDPGPPGQNLSGPSRDRDYVPRERRVRFGVSKCDLPTYTTLNKASLFISDVPRGFKVSSISNLFIELNV